MAEFKWFAKKPFPFLKAKCGIFGTQNEGKQYTILTFFVNIYSNTQHTHSFSLFETQNPKALSLFFCSYFLTLQIPLSGSSLSFIPSLSLPSHAKKKIPISRIKTNQRWICLYLKKLWISFIHQKIHKISVSPKKI